MAAVTKSCVDLDQGWTEHPAKFGGAKFGYVAGDGGGYFFTWLPTLDQTIDSLEVDEQDGDGELNRDEVADFLREYLPTTRQGRGMWAEDAE
jgi:hypothetical protein